MPGLPGLVSNRAGRTVRPRDWHALAVIDKQLETAASGPGVEVEPRHGRAASGLFRRFMPYAPFPGPASSVLARQLVDSQRPASGKKPVTPGRGGRSVPPSDGSAGTVPPRRDHSEPRTDVLNWFRRQGDRPAGSVRSRGERCHDGESRSQRPGAPARGAAVPAAPPVSARRTYGPSPRELLLRSR